MKTVRRPPYPKWNPGYFPCSSLTPLPLSSRRPSVSFGGFGLRKGGAITEPSYGAHRRHGPRRALRPRSGTHIRRRPAEQGVEVKSKQAAGCSSTCRQPVPFHSRCLASVACGSTSSPEDRSPTHSIQERRTPRTGEVLFPFGLSDILTLNVSDSACSESLSKASWDWEIPTPG